MILFHTYNINQIKIKPNLQKNFLTFQNGGHKYNMHYVSIEQTN